VKTNFPLEVDAVVHMLAVAVEFAAIHAASIASPRLSAVVKVTFVTVAALEPSSVIVNESET